MTKNRLEAFSDGVIAIIITIMVLELKVPHDPTLQGLMTIAPIFLSYVLSFTLMGIYWNNHHHLLHSVQQVGGASLWANLHLLFWLSLIPFTTGYMGENHFAPLTVAVYGVDLLMSGFAYYILTQVLMREHASNEVLRRAVGKDWKGIVSTICYVVALAFCFVDSRISLFIYVAVAVMWLVPDRRLEPQKAKKLRR